MRKEIGAAAQDKAAIQGKAEIWDESARSRVLGRAGRDSGNTGAYVQPLTLGDLTGGMAEKTPMDVLTAISTRASIRAYTEEQIGESDLHAILDAGFCAPSATNKRAWEFIVVKSAEARKGIADASVFGKMIEFAPCCIVVCGDNAKQKREEFNYQDCAAAIENMLLAAHGLGLGAVWCGVYSSKEWRPYLEQALSLPASVQPIGIVVLGRPAEQKIQKDRFEAEQVHFEKW